MTWRGACLALILATTPDAEAAENDQLPSVIAEIAHAKDTCMNLGIFGLDIRRAVKYLPDLNGDKRPNVTVDCSGFVCHGAYLIYGGTVGNPLVVVFISGDRGFLVFIPTHVPGKPLSSKANEERMRSW